jgi:hypothetical protein
MPDPMEEARKIAEGDQSVAFYDERLDQFVANNRLFRTMPEGSSDRTVRVALMTKYFLTEIKPGHLAAMLAVAVERFSDAPAVAEPAGTESEDD